MKTMICSMIKKPVFDIEDEEGMIHVIPCSGGADSSALAVYLHEKFPHINFKVMMTDTGAESSETMDFLKVVESRINNTIEIVRGEYTLFELIEKFNGYLPSAQSRWCTRELKLKPFQKWMRQFSGQPMTMYVGIRADEASRVAFDVPGVETVMPFKEMGWGREDVFGYLSETVGVPKTYLGRTRSGCSVCPFTRRQENINLYQRLPTEFERGMRYEKLSDEDLNRHQPGIPLWKDSGIALNWQSLPLPKENSILQGSKSKSSDMFEQCGLFAAGEFFMDSMPGQKPFIWQQGFISYSTSLHGIKRQIDDRLEHLLRTAEVHDMTANELRQQVRFAIWYIEFPDDVLDIKGPIGKSYTWQQGQSYAQIRHLTDHLKRALHAEHLRVLAQENHPLLSVEYEWSQTASKGLAAASGDSVGSVVDSMWYKPKEPTDSIKESVDDDESKLIPCPFCTI